MTKESERREALQRQWGVCKPGHHAWAPGKGFRRCVVCNHTEPSEVPTQSSTQPLEGLLETVRREQEWRANQACGDVDMGIEEMDRCQDWADALQWVLDQAPKPLKSTIHTNPVPKDQRLFSKQFDAFMYPPEERVVQAFAPLLPCPFCGGEAELSPEDPNWRWVSCPSCLVEGPQQPTEPAAIKAWNTRA